LRLRQWLQQVRQWLRLQSLRSPQSLLQQWLQQRLRLQDLVQQLQQVPHVLARPVVCVQELLRQRLRQRLWQSCRLRLCGCCPQLCGSGPGLRL